MSRPEVQWRQTVTIRRSLIVVLAVVAVFFATLLSIRVEGARSACDKNPRSAACARDFAERLDGCPGEPICVDNFRDLMELARKDQ